VLLNCCESGVEQPLSSVCSSSESFTRPKPELALASLLRRVMHAQLEACVHRVVANWRVWLGCSHLKQKEVMERERADVIKKSPASSRDRLRLRRNSSADKQLRGGGVAARQGGGGGGGSAAAAGGAAGPSSHSVVRAARRTGTHATLHLSCLGLCGGDACTAWALRVQASSTLALVDGDDDDDDDDDHDHTDHDDDGDDDDDDHHHTDHDDDGDDDDGDDEGR
jgi:hypothetical protein